MTYIPDNVDKRILFELDRNARIPETKLAKIINKSKEAVRYRIKRMKDEKIILGFTTWIDPTKLGYQPVKMYLNLYNNPEKKKKLIEYVKEDKRLFWLGVADGAWNIGLTFFVNSNQEFFDLKNKILSEFRDLIIDIKTATVVSVSISDKTFLHKSENDWLIMFDKQNEIELDEIGIKVLKELFNNSRENIASIAHKYKTSADIVKNRMNKFEAQKIICRYGASIDYDKLGYEFYKTFIYFNDLDELELSKFVKFCKMNQNVIHIVKQISPWDIELEIMCPNYKEYNKIIGELTERFTNINRIETAVIGEDHVFPSKKLIFE